MKPEDFLIELLKMRSYSGEENKYGYFLINRLKNKFKIVTQKIKNSYNLLAYVGEPKILFSSHLDTVNGEIEIKKDRDYIYGRGACDTKSQTAAMILACEKALEEGKSNFGLLFTVCEEDDLEGAKEIVKIIPKSVKLIILGEPTNLDLIAGHRGFIDFKLICRGKSAHGSTPENGINAIEKLIDELNKLRRIKFEENKYLKGNALNIGVISGGVSSNIVPDYAEANISIRNSVSSEKIINKLKSSLNAEIEILNAADPVISQGAEEFAKQLEIKSIVVPYFTEAYYLSKCAKTFVIGAGTILDAHSTHEKVKINELNRLVDIYSKIIDLKK